MVLCSITHTDNITSYTIAFVWLELLFALYIPVCISTSRPASWFYSGPRQMPGYYFKLGHVSFDLKT